MTRLLTRNTDQTIYGNVNIFGNVYVSNHTGVNINILNSENLIFGINLNDFLDDCIELGSDRLHIKNNIWFSNVTINQLEIEENFWPYGMDSVIIRDQLNSLRDRIILNGPLEYKNIFYIKELYFTDYINDVARHDFGTAWLLSETDQVSL